MTREEQMRRFKEREIDGGDIIVHIFRPEVREFYNLERIWASDAPPTARAATAS